MKENFEYKHFLTVMSLLCLNCRLLAPVDVYDVFWWMDENFKLRWNLDEEIQRNGNTKKWKICLTLRWEILQMYCLVMINQL